MDFIVDGMLLYLLVRDVLDQLACFVCHTFIITLRYMLEYIIWYFFAGWGKDFWRCFVYGGARVIGLNDRRRLAIENRLETFPEVRSYVNL